MNQFFGKIKGFNCFFTNSSYNCPTLKLYGYSTERQLKNAIRSKLARLPLAT